MAVIVVFNSTHIRGSTDPHMPQVDLAVVTSLRHNQAKDNGLDVVFIAVLTTKQR